MSDETPKPQRGAPRKSELNKSRQKTITLENWVWLLIDRELGDTPSQKIQRLVERKNLDRYVIEPKKKD